MLSSAALPSIARPRRIASALFGQNDQLETSAARLSIEPARSDDVTAEKTAPITEYVGRDDYCSKL